MSWRIQNLPDSSSNSAGPAVGCKKKSKSSSDGRGAIKRLIKELDVWRGEQKDERGIERLGPVDDEDLLLWQAVINGRGIGNGYDGMKDRISPSLLLNCASWQPPSPSLPTPQAPSQENTHKCVHC